MCFTCLLFAHTLRFLGSPFVKLSFCVGTCIRFESLVIVRLCVFCTVCVVSSESSDTFCVVAVSEGFDGCISDVCGNCGYSGFK